MALLKLGRGLPALQQLSRAVACSSAGRIGILDQPSSRLAQFWWSSTSAGSDGKEKPKGQDDEAAAAAEAADGAQAREQAESQAQPSGPQSGPMTEGGTLLTPEEMMLQLTAAQASSKQLKEQVHGRRCMGGMRACMGECGLLCALHGADLHGCVAVKHAVLGRGQDGRGVWISRPSGPEQEGRLKSGAFGTTRQAHGAYSGQRMLATGRDAPCEAVVGTAERKALVIKRSCRMACSPVACCMLPSLTMSPCHRLSN